MWAGYLSVGPSYLEFMRASLTYRSSFQYCCCLLFLLAAGATRLQVKVCVYSLT